MQFDMCSKRLREFFLRCLQYESDQIKQVVDSYDLGARTALYMDLECVQEILTKEIDERFSKVESKYNELSAKYNIKDVIDDVYSSGLNSKKQ